MAVVSQVITAVRNYSPFEGMSEARRLQTAVPRGLIRFDQAVGQTIAAKPVNDSFDMQINCSLPSGFAYVISSLAFELAVDTATDFDAVCLVSIFNGIPNAPVGNFQRASMAMANNPNAVAADPSRVLHYQQGDLRTWWPNPIVQTALSTAHTLILNYHNSAAAVMASGTLQFHASLYQYELNQAVRFPLNFPLPVGIR